MRRLWFWLILLALVAAAAVPRLLSYGFSLPYVDHPDEPNRYLSGLEARGLYDSNGYFVGYPPAYIGIEIALQPTLERLGYPGLAPTVRVLRLVSVLANLLTMVAIAQVVRLSTDHDFVTDLAALVAAAAWGVSPLVLENGVYALPDPILYLLTVVAVWLAASAATADEVGKRRRAVYSILIAALAILLKYSVLPIVLPSVVAAVILAARHRDLHDFGRLALVGLLAALIVGWTYNRIGVMSAAGHNEAGIVAEGGFSALFDPARVFNNLYFAVVPLNVWAFAALGLLASVGAVYAKFVGLKLVKWEVVIISMMLLVTVPWLAAAFGQSSSNYRMRDVLPATSVAAALMGMALVQVAYASPKRVNPRYTVVLGSSLLVALVFLPQLRGVGRVVGDRIQHDSRVELRHWMDENFEAGTVFVTRENDKTFNPYWGGLQGQQWFDWQTHSDITTRTLDDWRDNHGIRYAVLPDGDVDELEASADGRGYLDAMLHLRDFDGGRGPAMSAFRTWRMEHETDVTFGEAIRLVGYDLSATEAAPGDALTFRFYWQTTATPTDNYSLFIHLTPLDERDILAQVDGAPARLSRPTLTWTHPSETLVSDAVSLRVPERLSAGEYRVIIGLYNFESGARLSVSTDDDFTLLSDTGLEPGDALVLTTVRVEDS